MPQIFRRSANTLSKVSIVGLLLLVGGLIGLVMVLGRSSYVTRAQEFIEQPVQFSHLHHVGDDGIDCRYCHTSVETSSFAGIPPTKTCMNCHSQIWSTAPILEPVRSSFREDRALRWVRVHDLPDFVYFNHSVHIKGWLRDLPRPHRTDAVTLQQNSPRWIVPRLPSHPHARAAAIPISLWSPTASRPEFGRSSSRIRHPGSTNFSTATGNFPDRTPEIEASRKAKARAAAIIGAPGSGWPTAA